MRRIPFAMIVLKTPAWVKVFFLLSLHICFVFHFFGFIIWSLSKRFAGWLFLKLKGEYECHKYFIFLAHLALFLTFRPCQQSTQ